MDSYIVIDALLRIVTVVFFAVIVAFLADLLLEHRKQSLLEKLADKVASEAGAKLEEDWKNLQDRLADAKCVKTDVDTLLEELQELKVELNVLKDEHKKILLKKRDASGRFLK